MSRVKIWDKKTKSGHEQPYFHDFNELLQNAKNKEYS